MGEDCIVKMKQIGYLAMHVSISSALIAGHFMSLISSI